MKLSNPVSESIWADRYRKNGEKLDQNLMRVATFCADNDKDIEDFYMIMDKGLFFPGGRTMSNAGIGRNLTLNNCFAQGSKVITKRGMVNIEDIVVGDEVITHTNTWKKVVNTLCRDFEGDLFKISSLGLYEDIICTPNHKFLTQYGWKRADRLLYGGPNVCHPDKLKVPQIAFPKKYDTIDVTEGVDLGKNRRICYIDNKVICEVFCKNQVNTFWHKRGYEVNRYIEVDEDFRYFIGRWIGDGCVGSYRQGEKVPTMIQLVFNSVTERDAAKRCIDIGTRKFGHEPNIQEGKSRKVIAVYWQNPILASWIKNEFGVKCDGKHLDDKYLGDLEIAKGLLDADGTVGTHGSVGISLRNRKLLEWLRITLFLNGINTNYIKDSYYEGNYSLSVSCAMGRGRLIKHLSKYYIDSRQNLFCDDELLNDYIPMKNIEILENCNCRVYNLSVEEDNSYTVNGVVVHNCFVAPQIQDSLSDIFEKVKLGAVTHQRGGGIGYDFSQLRPKGSPTSNDAIASGAVSFMDCFNAQTATILQGNRRGANMGMMNVYCLDIEDFINAKSYDAGKLVHFNVTVMVDNAFMDAKNKDENIWLHFPVYDDEGSILLDETKWKYKKEISAKYLWDLITKKAYDNGEPGIAFYDNMNKDNNLWYIEHIICSNPCFEYLAGTIYGKNPRNSRSKLDPNKYGGACNLGSVLLHNFVLNAFREDAVLDYELLGETIHTAVRFLDNIIDKNIFPDKIYENYQKAFRTIGLGVTGFADMLVMLGIRYNSDEGYNFADHLMNFIALNVYKSSVSLAKEKGSFPFLKKKDFVEGGFIKKHVGVYPGWEDLRKDILKYGIRNGKMMSIAPTGTMSLTFGNNCSSGIEPIFSLSQKRDIKMGGQDEKDTKSFILKDYAYSLWCEDNIEIEKSNFVTALDMSVEEHIEMLIRIAKHTDMSVSKTINVPTEYPFEKTQEIYEKCWSNGIKGCTIFRPNALRQGIIVSNDKEIVKENITDEEIEEVKEEMEGRYGILPWGTTIEASDDLIGKKRKITTGCGNLHVLAWFDPVDGRLLEIFLSKGSTGGCLSWMTAASRVMSQNLRSGVPIESLVDQLKSSPACTSYTNRTVVKHDTSRGNSCPCAVANAILDMQKEIDDELGEYEEGDVEEVREIKVEIKVEEKAFVNKKSIEEREFLEKYGEVAFAKHFTKCPECGCKLLNIESCLQCSCCGFSKCG